MLFECCQLYRAQKLRNAMLIKMVSKVSKTSKASRANGKLETVSLSAGLSQCKRSFVCLK